MSPSGTAPTITGPRRACRGPPIGGPDPAPRSTGPVARRLLAWTGAAGAGGRCRPIVRAGSVAAFPGTLAGMGARQVVAQAAGVLLLGSLLLSVVLLVETVEPALLVGVLGALLCLWRVRPDAGSATPATVLTIAARERRRALARRGVPAQRDPDAAGRTRSRTPSGLFPAV